MAAVRRSTRLSSISKAAAASPSTQTQVQTPRRSEVWRRRQPKQVLADSDEEEETVDHHLIGSVSENNENRNLLNKMDKDRAARRRTNPGKLLPPSQHQLPEEQKTPRSTKEAAAIARSREAATIFVGSSSEEEQEVDVLQVSPPKQRRLQPLPQHLISPSRLLDRLSIDERQEEDAEAKTDKKQEMPLKKHAETKPQETTSRPKPKPAAKQQAKPEQEPQSEPETLPSPPRNKYQNARRVLNSAETQNLPGREEQLLELREFFTSHLESQTSGSLYVSGQPGTGKTACLSLLLRDPAFSKRLQRVYINCTSIASVGAVYKKLCAELQLKPNGRTERDHLEAIQRHLRSAKRMLLLVLDEIDQLSTSRQAVLYTIFEWPALPGARILLVGIANSLDLTDRALMRLNARCELKPRLMHFPPYSKQQIVEIFKSRLAEAEVLDVFPPVTLQLLAAKVSAISGDVRRALDIGRRVVEIAEQQKRDGEKEFNLKALNLEGKDLEEAKEKQGKVKPHANNVELVL